MAHFDALARQPRPAGGAAVATALDYCERQLTPLGFTVTRRPFQYSSLPGRYAAPIIGGAGSILALWSVLLAARASHSTIAVSVATIAVTILLVALLGGSGSTRVPLLTRSAVNLEATRGPDPRVWLVAHIDSKSQPVSTAVRTVGVVLLAVAMIALLFLRPAPPRALIWLIVFCSAVGGIILLWSVVGSNSDGAADNASGVAAVLDATGLVAPGPSFGVLITDAEELALAGARAWVRGREPGIAINCDTVDDAGRLVLMRYRRSSELAGRGKLIAKAEDPEAIVIRPLPGVLTDSVAFAAARWRTLTLSRGTLRTLTRIHTVRDTAREMHGTGIPAAARVLARLVEELA